MVKTKFDRWLIETLVYEHHIRVVRVPQKLPTGAKVSEITAKQFHYLIVVKNRNKADQLIEDLTSCGAIYSTRIIESNHWYNPLIFNKNKSFTFSVFWWTVTGLVTFYLYTQIKIFMASDKFFELKESLQQLLLK